MIAELLRMLGTPVTVVASSLTAGIVVRLAIQQPHLFKRLCLVCPSGFNDFGEDQGQAIANALLNVPILDRLIYTVAAANPLAVRNFLSQFIFANPQRLRPEIVEAYLDAACRPNAEWATLATLKGNLSFDLSQYLPQLTIPTVILWGEKGEAHTPFFGGATLCHRLRSPTTVSSHPQSRGLAPSRATRMGDLQFAAGFLGLSCPRYRYPK